MPGTIIGRSRMLIQTRAVCQPCPSMSLWFVLLAASIERDFHSMGGCLQVDFESDPMAAVFWVGSFPS